MTTEQRIYKGIARLCTRELYWRHIGDFNSADKCFIRRWLKRWFWDLK